MLGVSYPRWLLLASLLFVVGFSLALAPRGQTGPRPLIVYAAASLRKPLESIAPEFRQKIGWPLELRFGGSEAILNQIRLSRGTQPGDLFIPADESYFLAAADLVAKRFPIASMKAVVMLSTDAKPVTTWDELLSPGRRLALAQPDIAAIGRLTREHLQQQNQWTAFQQRLVVAPDNVVQSATAVELKAVDAAIVWDAVAAGFPNARTVELPELSRIKASVEVGLLKCSPQPEAALKLAHYLADASAGSSHFRRLGFAAPELIR